MSHRLRIAALTIVASSLSAMAPAPSSATDAAIERPTEAASAIEEATKLIAAGNPTAGLQLVEKVIAEAEPKLRDRQRLAYSAQSTAQALVYATLGAAAGKEVVVYESAYADAYFLKGFALIDLGRQEEALKWFNRAIALSPMNAQYLAERGEWYKQRKEWGKAFKDYESSLSYAGFAGEAQEPVSRGRALRGMAFVRIEQGRLGDAEALLKQALTVDPRDAKAKSELDYITSLRR